MRLDKYLAEHGFSSRTKAARALSKGLVRVNGKIGKASDDVTEKDDIFVESEKTQFVSEGGYKLYKAFCDFGVDVKGCVFADIGASTGGFTDCLLQSGAAFVYCVDVGKSQLSAELAQDERVCVMDGVNARYLQGRDFSRQIDGMTADVSFISLTLIIPALARILTKGKRAFLLIKPQFECEGKGQDKHGIVKDEVVRIAAVQRVYECAVKENFSVKGITNAPLHKNKNIEYVLFLEKEGECGLCETEVLERARQLT